ncbi:MAG: 2-amino-4-hydroxy-6-hydroxymethyldihydropteridine diphosphokinase [Candidatus Kapabacteria bacterium]|jgi:2-amino-4-hydroxy-6-hydroxymethyldihydropteridine diphosphokinase|nr:2-amino-4-hydroxy-6-hydroxymethyldihydropteridine diphosphokinase [Candidatus Kapabacteria bacterium]
MTGFSDIADYDQVFCKSEGLAHGNELSKVLLSVGSNLGNRLENIQNAVRFLKLNGIIINPVTSSVYETAPYGVTRQPDFLNISIYAETATSPFELLFIAKSMEYLLGRKIRNKWHEREIDIDIIIYDSLVYNNKMLTLPHNQFRNRRFVLMPSAEIASNLVDPVTKKNIKQLLRDCMDISEVQIFGKIQT